MIKDLEVGKLTWIIQVNVLKRVFIKGEASKSVIGDVAVEAKDKYKHGDCS